METVTNEAIISRLIESDQGKKIAADILRDYTTERINMKAQIETLRRERGQQGRELADGVEVTRKRVEQARKILTEAEQEHRVAVMQQQQTAAHFSTRIGKLERELRATAPAIISDFITWLNDQETVCTDTGIIETAQVTGRVNTHTSQAIRAYFSNAEGLRERLAAIRAARSEAEKLKDKVLDTTDIEQRLGELREGLPGVSMQFSHEK